MKKKEFLQIAGMLNEQLQIVPLLFGSLGLGQRLRTDLKADDIDVLIPEVFLNEKWERLVSVMDGQGYTLYDAHEHAFEKAGLSVAFASIESLMPFAGIDPGNIPIVEETGVRYYLLELQDYLKVYTESAKDGYRKDKKHKEDGEKVELIRKALGKETKMKIAPMDVADPRVLQLFSEHDDFMIEFLGENQWLYTRYNENEKIERSWVAFSDTVPMGCIAYRKKTDGVGEVKRLFLRSEYRGNKISKELLDTVERYAKEQGCHTLFLDTRITLEPAVSIYRSFGFSIVFQQGLYIQMEKKLCE